MKAAIFGLLLLAALVSADKTDPLVLKEAGVRRVDIPKDNFYYFWYNVTEELANMTSGGPDMDVNVDFVYFDTGRELTAYVGTSFDDSSAAQFIFDEDGNHKFTLSSFPDGCTHGCSVYIKIKGMCTTCANDITTRVWARLMHRSSGEYVYSNDKLPYMPLYLNTWSPEITVDKTHYKYFTYVSATNVTIRVSKDSSIGSDMLLISGKNEITMPTTDNSKWTMLEDVAAKSIVAGNNYLALYGGESILNSNGKVCVGEGCEFDFAPTLVPAALLMLFATILALF